MGSFPLAYQFLSTHPVWYVCSKLNFFFILLLRELWVVVYWRNDAVHTNLFVGV